jgi:chemotaxis regulatin CheY-phosphate phosphatase CheZ
MKNGEFTKTDWIIYCICIVIVVLICLLGGCTTTRITTDPGDIRQSNAYIIGELTQSVDEFDRGLGEATEKSRNITDAIDRVDYLFQQYEQKAIRLRNEVDTLRERLQKEEQDYNNRNSNNSAAHIDDNSNTGA